MLLFCCLYMTTIDNAFLAKSSTEFCCDMCDYITIRKYNFNKHLQSMKHKNNAFDYKNNAFVAKSSKTYLCTNCDKYFKDRAGLWRHSKRCCLSCVVYTPPPEKPFIQGLDKDDLIITLLKQNADLIKGQQDLIKGQQDVTMELAKHTSTNTTIHTNSHNKAFNLNFFLNETCKNAMNITDFIDSIKLQLSDFINVGDVGFVDGISNIIVKKLNDLDETVRPIHCTDQKRETFYVKDQDKWEKEDDDKKKIKKLIKTVAFRNENLMKTYKETFPDYNNPESKRSDQYSKTVIEAMGGIGENHILQHDKIIRNILKVTTIRK